MFLLKESCPSCKSGRVRYSSTLSKHISRMFRRSRRRYCLSCENKWTSESKSKEFSIDVSRFSKGGLPIVIGIIVGIFASVLAGVSFNPINWFKGKVVQAYHEEHGKGHTKNMWSDLKGFYGSRGEAISDYRSHSN